MSLIVLFLEFVTLFAVKGRDGSVSVFIATAMIFLFSLFFLFDLKKSKDFSLVATPVFLGYLFRITLIYFDLFGRGFFTLPNSGADTEMFYSNSIRYMHGLSARNHLFIKVMGSLFKIIGTNRVYAQFLIALLAVFAVLIMVKTLRILGLSNQATYKSTFIACLLPNFAVLSSIFLRESIVVFFMAISFYFFIRWIVYNSDFSFFLSFVFCFIASAFHSGVVAAAAGYIIVRILYNPKEKRFDLSFKGMIVSIVFLALFVFLFNNFSSVLFAKMSDIESLEDIANTNTRGGSSYAAYVGNSSNPLNMILFTVPRMFFFIFSPLPWQWRGVSDIIAFSFSSLFYISIIVKAFKIRKLTDGFNSRMITSLLIVAFSCIFVFGWGCSNSGTALRHREKLVILFSLIYALSLSVNNETT